MSTEQSDNPLSTVPFWLGQSNLSWGDYVIPGTGSVVFSRTVTDPESGEAVTQMRIDPIGTSDNRQFQVSFANFGDISVVPPFTTSLSQGLGLYVGGPPALVANSSVPAAVDLANLDALPLSAAQHDMLLRVLGDGISFVKVFKLANDAGAANGTQTLGIARDADDVGLGHFIAVVDTTGLSADLRPQVQLANVDVLVLVGDAITEISEGSTTVIRQQPGNAPEILAGLAGGDVQGGVGGDILTGAAGDDRLLGGVDDSGAWQFSIAANGAMNAFHNGGAVDTTTLNQHAAQLGFLNSNPQTLALLPLLYSVAFHRVGDLEGLSYWAQSGLDAQGLADAFVNFTDPTLDDAGFVDRIFRNAYGAVATSAPAQELAQTLVAELSDGTRSRGEVMLLIANDPSVRQSLTTADGMPFGQDSHGVTRDWMRGSGDDTLAGGAGSNFLAGGDGTDTAVFSGNLSDYLVSTDAAGNIQVIQSGVSRDTLSSVEKLQFADVSFDLSTHAWAEKVVPQNQAIFVDIVALYIGLFGRLPDAQGARYWGDRALQGETLSSVAQAMEDAGRVHQNVGANPYALNDDDFALSVFANLLGESNGNATTNPLYGQVRDGLAQGHSRAETVLWLAHELASSAADGSAGQEAFYDRTDLGVQHALWYGLDYGDAKANIEATQRLIQRPVAHGDTVLMLMGVQVNLDNVDWSNV